jgi:hypothetical protein
MRRIFWGEKEINTLSPEILPMLIHGKHGSGASLYTICMAAQWFSQGYSILFLSGYPMAEQAFAKEVGSKYSNAKFYTLDTYDEFITVLRADVSDNTIVIIKNIDLFYDRIINKIKNLQNVIISGDISNIHGKDPLLNTNFSTEIYFSSLNNKKLPPLENYQGYVYSKTYQGFTKLQ